MDDRNQFVSVDGKRRVSDVRINDEALDPEKVYTLTGNAFLLSGGDGYTMFKDAKAVTMTTLTDIDVMVKYIEEELDGVIPDTYKEISGSRIIFDK